MHTPTPWHKGSTIAGYTGVYATKNQEDAIGWCDFQDSKDFDFMLAACNAHEQIKEALREAHESFQKLYDLGRIPANMAGWRLVKIALADIAKAWSK